MGIRPEVLPFVGVAIVAGLLVALVARRLMHAASRRAGLWGLAVALIAGAYFLYFFRDPERVAPSDPAIVVAGADGHIAALAVLKPGEFRRMAAFCGLAGADLEAWNGDVARISIFLSLFDVHVNRAPIAGASRFLGYFPGRHLFTFTEKSSDVNQHNSILIVGQGTRCLVNQIVGPVARRVVYWPDHDRAVELPKGARVSMMKFGSRMDMYFPAADVEVAARVGDTVRAGETPVARLRGKAKE